jgi:hypothetical protein
MTFFHSALLLLFNFDRESPMSTLSVPSKKRSVLWLPVYLELMLVFVGLVVYAILASINQKVSLFVIMIASLTGATFSFLSKSPAVAFTRRARSRGTGSRFSRSNSCLG